MSMNSRSLKKSAVATLVAAAAVSGLSVLPAHADTPSSIVSAVQSQLNDGHTGSNGAGYSDGVNQGGSLANPTEWCADFAGWAWAQAGVADLGILGDGAASFYDYGRRYGTLSGTPQVGDAVVFGYNASSDSAAHVAIVTAVNSNGTINWIGGNQGTSGLVTQDSGMPGGVGDYEWTDDGSNVDLSGFIAPVTSLNNTPSTLPAGTLVKSPDSAEVKVIIGGAGIAVSASDVSADGYDLSKIVSVTDAAFNALPATPPDGTVVKDQSGANATVYVIVDDTALPVTAAEFTADGWSTKPLMGVPTSWLQTTAASTLPSGSVVYNENGTDPSRYVMVDGVALPISGAEWTADGYNTRPLLGVPGTWLAGAVAGTLPAGAVVMNQSGTDSNRYVMIGGAALHITAAEWTADGYSTRALMGVPGTWLAGAVAAAPANGTVVEDQAGTSANRYVMVGGTAALISASEWTGNGYNTRPLLGVPATWLATAAAATPANGTLVQASGSSAVYLVTGGDKELLTASQFGTGGYSYSNVVLAPAALLAQLPTTTG